MKELVKNTEPLKCPRCTYVSHQRYNVFRLAALLNHYQVSHGYYDRYTVYHGYEDREVAYARMSDEVCRRKR